MDSNLKEKSVSDSCILQIENEPGGCRNGFQERPVSEQLFCERYSSASQVQEDKGIELKMEEGRASPRTKFYEENVVKGEPVWKWFTQFPVMAIPFTAVAVVVVRILYGIGQAIFDALDL